MFFDVELQFAHQNCAWERRWLRVAACQKLGETSEKRARFVAVRG
jgi:hypothetical protein